MSIAQQINIPPPPPFDVIATSKEVVVYGYSKALYEEVSTKITNLGKEVYLHNLCTIESVSLSKRSFIEIPIESFWTIGFICKSSLVSIVIENYLRKKEGTELIPVIFCLNSNKDPSLLPAEAIVNKSKNPTLGFLSNQEIRRIYKLCFDPSIPLEIRNTALKTFQFVTVILSSFDDILDIQPTEAPWENNRQEPDRNNKWTSAWEEKIIAKKDRPAKPPNSNWRIWVHKIAESQGTIDPQSICFKKNTKPKKNNNLLQRQPDILQNALKAIILHFFLDARKIDWRPQSSMP